MRSSARRHRSGGGAAGTGSTMGRHRTALLFGLTTAGLLASLLLNLWLIRQSRIWERHFYLTRLDPVGVGAYPTAGPPASGPRVVFYGDSRVEEWRLPAPPPGVEYLNRGISGQSSTQALLRYEAHVAPLQPDILVIQVGVNDLISIRLLERQREAIVAATKANLAALVGRARADGGIVVLTTIFPPAAPGLGERLVPPTSSVAAVDEVNRFIATLAGEGVIIFDSAALLAEDGVVRDSYRSDMWHLNAEGYQALNAALDPLLRDLIP